MEATAVREAEEELNIRKENIDVLGSITPIYVPPSNFIIHPFVAYQESVPDFIAQESEVAEILECPLTIFLGEEKLKDSTVQTVQGDIKVKGFPLGKRIIWGATGMILKEFAEIIEPIITPNEQ